MIVSGALGRLVIPEIETWSQLDSVYVFCQNQAFHEQWANNRPKVKGVFTDIELVCKALKDDSANCDRSMMPISFNGMDAFFMYTQLLKEAFLQIKDDDKRSIQQLVEFCRLQDDVPEDHIKLIEHEYQQHSPIWWYTSQFSMCSMINRALRLMDIDIILKMGFFVRHLHQDLERLYREQQSKNPNRHKLFRVFRGQGLSSEDFEKMKKSIGNLMSFNNFLSTSRQHKVAVKDFARPAASKPNALGILFDMIIDPKICVESSVTFADVQDFGYFGGQEEEILFSTHTVFHIDNIEPLADEHSNRLWQVNLTLVGNDNHVLNSLIAQLRQQYSWTNGWSRLGHILIKIEESEKAEQLYKSLLENSRSDQARAEYNHQLGTVYKNLHDFPKALFYYDEYVKIKTKTVPPNHPELAGVYNNIGLVYKDMKEYSKALSYYELSTNIRNTATSEDLQSLAGTYNNIGMLYEDRGEFMTALLSYEMCLENREKSLDPHHPDLAAIYNNIGKVYDKMGEYSKALFYLKKALNIRQKSLLPNHSYIAESERNIEAVKNKMNSS